MTRRSPTTAKGLVTLEEATTGQAQTMTRGQRTTKNKREVRADHAHQYIPLLEVLGILKNNNKRLANMRTNGKDQAELWYAYEMQPPWHV